MSKSFDILIVEDNVDFLESYANLLQANGWTVITADNGYMAKDLLEEYTFKIVTVDIMMPGIDGFELMQYILDNVKETYNPTVFALSSLTSAVAMEEALRLGAKKYLLKTELEVKDFIKEIKIALKEKNENK
jgi:DNA-binding response OmpR family regulator